MTPVIALPEISLPGPGASTGDTDRPELPGLSALLRYAAPMPAEIGWRAGVQAALGMTATPVAGPAAVAACAVNSLAPGAGVCLAAPVHVVAGISRVFFAEAGDSVEPALREELRLAFNAEFGSAELQLHRVGAQWLLQAPFALAADDECPELLAGMPLAREPSRSEASKQLRRLGTEVEMWLASHPLNKRRDRHGMPSPNAFWFWGGDAVRALPAPAWLPDRFLCQGEPDAWLAGLAAHCRVSLSAASDWKAVATDSASIIVLYARMPASVWQHLARWDAEWFLPVQRDLADGRIRRLRLQIGARAWQIVPSNPWRWLRRQRPWWQVLA